ncbi:MAG: hypothetical protein IJS15_02270 [Victivallales bacterium]|nr:hypothetical protein [Victivallales bacterium]
MNINPFKYGCVVSGEFFCARPELERQLQEHALAGQNLVIQGARRMGKTSLIIHAINGMRDMHLIYIDLYAIKTLSDFCSRVMKGISKATNEMSFIKKAVQLAFRLRPLIAVDPHDGSATISVDARAAEEPDSLGAVMTTLDKMASEGKYCVVFDEFQDILNLENSQGILAEMRSTIQFQEHTPYFFSGSIRNAMMSIFDDMNSPFYKSALAFVVDTIEPIEFSKFIASRFEKGRRRIEESVIEQILQFSDGVSGDVQELCETLWETTDENDNITADNFPKALELIFSRELGGYETVVERLTPAQSSVLKALAIQRNVQPYSMDFLSAIGKPASTIHRVIEKLVSERLIFIKHGNYHFSNPFFREWLARKQ